MSFCTGDEYGFDSEQVSGCAKNLQGWKLHFHQGPDDFPVWNGLMKPFIPWLSQT